MRDKKVGAMCLIKNNLKSIRLFLRDILVNQKKRNCLTNDSFVIISSDCTGGVLYHDLHHEFESPTINMFFMASDFIKFIGNMNFYLDLPMQEIEQEQYNYPLAKIGDIVLHLVHYNSVEEAQERWNVRKQRLKMNCGQIVYVFNDRNGCTKQDLIDFDSLDLPHKVVFTHIPYPEIKSAYYIQGFEQEESVGIMTAFTSSVAVKRYLDYFDFVSWLNVINTSENHKVDVKKKLFLTNGKRDMVRQGNYGSQIEALSVYKNESKLNRLIVKILLKNHSKYARFFLGRWARSLDDYAIIVCEGLGGKAPIFEYVLNNKDSDTRLIMWHWNKIFEYEINPYSDLACKCEQWSFDPDDCKNFNLKFNTQYFETPEVQTQKEFNFDLYFLGSDKGRLRMLESFYKKCSCEGIKVKFHVVKSKRGKQKSEILPFSKNISYKDNINNVMSSLAILDIPLKGQRGLTLRVMEALYLQKKLVTFNKSVKELTFYNSNNILICNEEIDAVKLKEFIQSPFIETKECKEARLYYSFTEWMKRFEEFND